MPFILCSGARFRYLVASLCIQLIVAPVKVNFMSRRKGSCLDGSMYRRRIVGEDGGRWMEKSLPTDDNVDEGRLLGGVLVISV